ncbi:MAG TPA: membrane protein insertion efficiency factor YidD [Rhizomicrobium sp.]|jgi:putative membrane protein insertion efficiency factor
MKDILRRVSLWALLAPIKIYRWCISPMFPPACRFMPTCSEYAVDALTLHGPVKGSWLAARRVLRCHPVKSLGGASGFDPVPPPRAR